MDMRNPWASREGDEPVDWKEALAGLGGLILLIIFILVCGYI